MNKAIKVINANEKNLKNISFEVPENKIIAVTGISGSGKSTLMFDVILREYIRREKIINNKANDFEKFCRPDFEKFYVRKNVVGMNQKSLKKSDNSTVSTFSGINEIIKQIFNKYGQIYCSCGRIVPSTGNIDSVFFKIASLKNINILYKVKDSKNDEKVNWEIIKYYNINNFYNKELKNINIKTNSTYKNESIYGEISVDVLNNNNIKVENILLIKNSKILYDFSTQTFCIFCDEEYLSIKKSLFTKSKISKINGCCESCEGTSFIESVNFEELINDLPVSENFINIPYNGKSYKYIYLQYKDIYKITKNIEAGVDFFNLDIEIKKKLEDLITEKIMNHRDNINISKYIKKTTCNHCHGTGFNKFALSIKLKDLNIYQINNLSFNDLKEFFSNNEKIVFILKAIEDLSLTHLKLSRSTKTLSGGELQRLKILNTILNSMKDSIMIFDEISSGLSIDDQKKIINVIKELKNHNNTIFLIDHSEFITGNCDLIISLGPDSGVNGGKLLESNQSLLFERKIREKKIGKKNINLSNLTLNNLKNIDFYFPLNVLTTVIGVSGSGKSSLITSIKNKYINNKSLDVIYMAQDDLHKSSRSMIATYNEIFDDIRSIYADIKTSKLLNLSDSHFSPNTLEGACLLCYGKNNIEKSECRQCSGTGFNPISMSVLYNGFNIYEFLNLSFHTILKLDVNEKINKLSEIIIKLGIGHLSLGRTTSTLSGGESQRIKLAKFLLKFYANDGNKHTLLILDEPSKGLSDKDTTLLLDLLDSVISNNCSVITVEHNDYFIKNSDFIIELGPKSGDSGGEVVFCNYTNHYNFSDIEEENTKPKFILNKIPTNISEWIDDDYFNKIEYFYKKSDFKNRKSLTENHNDEIEYFFCPFVDDISNFKSVSKESFKYIKRLLESLGFKYYYYLNEKKDLKELKESFNHKEYLKILIKTKDLTICEILGGGVVIGKNNINTEYYTNRLFDIEKTVIGPRKINKNFFNKYFSFCPYCDGFGFRKYYNTSIFDKELLLDDMQLYKNLNFSKSDLYTIKNSIKKFMEEMIFNFHKKIDDLSELEYLYYLYGDPYVYFLKDGGRKNALSDRIYWYGIFKFFENYNDIIYTECECPYCLGSGYTQDIKYYLIDGKSIFDVN